MATKNMGTMTPTKGHPSKLVENFNPNVQTPGPKPFSKSSSSSSSPVLKKSPPPSSSSFSFSKSSALKNPNNSPRNKFRQRKFVNRSNGEQKHEEEEEEEEEEAVDAEIVLEKENEKDCSALNDLGRANNTKKRDRLMEVAKVSVPESGGGSGKVMNLVKAFEKLMNLSDSKDEEQNKEEKETEEGNNGKVVMKWPMAGLQFSRDLKTDEKESCSSFCPPDSVLTSESLGLDQQASLSSSWDSSRIRFDTFDSEVCLI
ncbi:hypothetical protein RIF29_14392 [Crotalaria pallida]|uniref:Uncharacterized protein n=1 Tax=Crotalaria pallida TaxID=3830 RepID=A0AAN9FHH6_CROPI